MYMVPVRKNHLENNATGVLRGAWILPHGPRYKTTPLLRRK
jgi:hypothetical protein